MKAQNIAFAILLSVVSGFTALEASDKNNLQSKTVIAAETVKVDPAKSNLESHKSWRRTFGYR